MNHNQDKMLKIQRGAIGIGMGIGSLIGLLIGIWQVATSGEWWHILIWIIIGWMAGSKDMTTTTKMVADAAKISAEMRTAVGRYDIDWLRCSSRLAWEPTLLAVLRRVAPGWSLAREVRQSSYRRWE